VSGDILISKYDRTPTITTNGRVTMDSSVFSLFSWMDFASYTRRHPIKYPNEKKGKPHLLKKVPWAGLDGK
jgi:hypothetical protein